MFRIIYYYYFLLYSKAFFIKEDERHWSAIASLSFTQVIILANLKNVFLVTLFCFQDDKLIIHFLILIAVFILNFYYYDIKKQGIKIEEEKPTLFGSKQFSLFFVVVFTVLAYSLLFAGGPILKSLGENCG